MHICDWKQCINTGMAADSRQYFILMENSKEALTDGIVSPGWLAKGHITQRINMSRALMHLHIERAIYPNAEAMSLEA